MNKFHKVTSQLELVLSGISYEKLDISDEVKEQVQIHHSAFLLLLGGVIMKDKGMYRILPRSFFLNFVIFTFEIGGTVLG